MTVENLRTAWGGHVPGLLGARRSYAVLCPLVERDDGLHLLFEVRAPSLHRQPGEVCFPGGRAEAGETAEDCALRETEEELGIGRERIEILGRPDFICNQAGFLLQPVLGLVSAAGFADLTPSPAEVAEVFTAPVAFFRQHCPERYRYGLEPQVPESFPYDQVGISRQYRWAKGAVEVPVWYYQGRAIWGMTARFVEEIAGRAR